MARVGRKPGTPKTGGRQPGTPNKRTMDLRERLAERMGETWCPVVAMAEIAESKDAPLDLRLRALAEIAPYLHARRRPQPGPQDALGLEALISGAQFTVLTAVPEPHPRPAASAAVAIEPPADLPAPPAPPPRPPLRLCEARGTVTTDYDPYEN